VVRRAIDMGACANATPPVSNHLQAGQCCVAVVPDRTGIDVVPDHPIQCRLTDINGRCQGLLWMSITKATVG
jgi:hypothetical protein